MKERRNARRKEEMLVKGEGEKMQSMVGLGSFSGKKSRREKWENERRERRMRKKKKCENKNEKGEETKIKEGKNIYFRR